MEPLLWAFKVGGFLIGVTIRLAFRFPNATIVLLIAWLVAVSV